MGDRGKDWMGCLWVGCKVIARWVTEAEIGWGVCGLGVR